MGAWRIFQSQKCPPGVVVPGHLALLALDRLGQARRTVKVTVFGMSGLTEPNLLITLAWAVGTVKRMIVLCNVALADLAPCLARRGGQGNRLSRPLDHLGSVAGARREHRLDRLDTGLQFLIAHRLHAAGMLQARLARHQQGRKSSSTRPAESAAPSQSPFARARGSRARAHK
jgi:hypothetical protein